MTESVFLHSAGVRNTSPGSLSKCFSADTGTIQWHSLSNGTFCHMRQSSFICKKSSENVSQSDKPL